MAQPPNYVARERNVQLVQRFITLVLERGLADVCEELMHPEMQFIDPSWPPSAPNGSAGIREAVRAIHEHFSGYTLRMDDIFAVGEDIVVNRFTGHAVHKGGFFGSNAVNRPLTWTGNTIYRFKDGLIHRIWLQWDLLGTLVQLDILPAPTPNTPPPWAVPPVPGTPYVASDRRDGGRAGEQASVETNLATVRRLISGMTSEPIETLVEACLSPDYRRDDNCALVGSLGAIEGFVQYVRATRENFEGYRTEIDDIFGEGDRVVVRARVSGLHLGGFLGVERGGQQIDFTLTLIYRMQAGKIGQCWVTWDVFRALNQMGAIPAAPATFDGP